MNTLLIIGNSSIKEKRLFLNISKKVSSEINVCLLNVDSLTEFKEKIKQNMLSINKSSKIFIIFTVSVLSLVNELINACNFNVKMFLCLSEKSLENLEQFIDNFYDKNKLILFRFDSYNFENNFCGIPVISFSCNIDDFDEYINYIIFCLKKYSNNTCYKLVCSKDLDSAISLIDREKEKYKYINNWLFDPENKLLCFLFNDCKYIAKRTTIEKANLEIKNAKILKKILDNVKINSFKVNIIIPTFCEVSSQYGYIVSRFYGNDLNQLYYENKTENLVFINEVYLKIKYLLESNHINFNGFLPRNVIFNNNIIYLIDFEDINNKDRLIVETTQSIAWSYFVDLNLKQIATLLGNENNIMLSGDMQKIVSGYPNMYKLALIAESSYNSFKKMDDIINVLSEYVSYEIELILDIILYEKSINSISINIEALLYSLVEKIKIISPFISRNDINKMVKLEIDNIFIYVQNNNCSQQLYDVLAYARKKIEV